MTDATSHRVRLYMGTHRPHWLATSDVPLFVCRKTLEPYKNLPRAVVPWVLDSGGFSELSAGAWHLRTRDAFRYDATVRQVDHWHQPPDERQDVDRVIVDLNYATGAMWWLVDEGTVKPGDRYQITVDVLRTPHDH